MGGNRVGDTAYFICASPARVERYDLGARTWLPAVTLPANLGAPTTGLVDGDGIYVTYGGKAVYRHDLAGGNPSLLLNSQDVVEGMVSDGNWLFINSDGVRDSRFISMDKATGQVAGLINESFFSVKGLSIAPGMNKIFGRANSVFSWDVAFVAYNDAGQLTDGWEGLYHADYPNAVKTWVFPSEARVVDSGGIYYNTTTLQYEGSLGTVVDDIQFPATGGAVVVRGKVMTGYTNGLMPSGSVALPFAPHSFYLDAADAVIFGVDSKQPNGISSHTVPIASLVPPPPTGGAVDPTYLAYVPDAVYLANDGTVLLVSRLHKSIFRWSTVTQQYIATIPLTNMPVAWSYSAARNSVYLGDAAGMVRVVNLDDASPVGTPFVILPTASSGLAVAGGYLLAADTPWTGSVQRTFDEAGRMVSEKALDHSGSNYFWSETAQRMYYTDGNTLCSEPINANGSSYPDLAPGEIGKVSRSKPHWFESGWYPIRVSPDGTMVIVASGSAFNGTTLSRLSVKLPSEVRDVVWHAGKVFSMRKEGTNTVLEKWANTTLAPAGNKQVAGKPLRLLSIDNTRLFTLRLSAWRRPILSVMDADFKILPPPSLATPGELAITTPSAGALLLEWSDVSGELGYQIQRKPVSSLVWSHFGWSGESNTSFLFKMTGEKETYDYRVVAAHGSLLSSPSEPLENVLSGPPLPPRKVELKATGATTASFRWKDGELENGYRIEARAEGFGWRLVGRADEDAVSAKVDDLRWDAKYEFRIAARNELGLSEWVELRGRTKVGRGRIAVYRGPAYPGLVDNKSVLNFGSMQVGRPGGRHVTLIIENAGSKDLQNVELEIAGPHRGDFSIRGGNKGVLADGGWMEVHVSFLPRASGERHAVLQIRSSDKNRSPFDILLLGRGYGQGEKGIDSGPDLTR